MRRLLLTRRWAGFTAVAALVAVTFVALGFWQLDRADQRAARNALVRANLEQPPVPVEALLGPGTPADPGAEWRPVRTTGRYDVGRTLLVRNRVLDGRPGFHVLVPLVTEAGPALLVNRGWLARTADATTAVAVPPPPAGDVQVSGRLRPGDRVDSAAGLERSDRPQPSVARLDVARIAADLPYPVYGGYVEATDEAPPAAATADAPVPIPAPEINPGPHLSYAFQWFLFATIGVVGWWLLLRREARAVDRAGRPPTRPVPTARAG